MVPFLLKARPPSFQNPDDKEQDKCLSHSQSYCLARMAKWKLNPGKGMVESGPLNQHYVNEKLSLWLPLVQKCDDVVGIERPCRLPLTIFLRIHQLTVSVE